jgi:hypothetical protein
MRYFITSQNFIHRHQKSERSLTCPKDSSFHLLVTPLIDFALHSHQDAFEEVFKTNYSLNLPRCIASLAEPVKFIQTLPKAVGVMALLFHYTSTHIQEEKMKRLAKSGKLSSSGFNLNTLTDSLEHVETYERAGEEVRHILETYEPPKLSDAVLKKVRDIVDGAEAELGITG